MTQPPHPPPAAAELASEIIERSFDLIDAADASSESSHYLVALTVVLPNDETAGPGVLVSCSHDIPTRALVKIILGSVESMMDDPSMQGQEVRFTVGNKIKVGGRG